MLNAFRFRTVLLRFRRSYRHIIRIYFFWYIFYILLYFYAFFFQRFGLQLTRSPWSFSKLSSFTRLHHSRVLCMPVASFLLLELLAILVFSKLLYVWRGAVKAMFVCIYAHKSVCICGNLCFREVPREGQIKELFTLLYETFFLNNIQKQNSCFWVFWLFKDIVNHITKKLITEISLVSICVKCELVMLANNVSDIRISASSFTYSWIFIHLGI